MSIHSNPLKMIVVIRNHDHFEAMNDFIAFQRHKVKDFIWHHGELDEDSTLTIEFHNFTDAIIFKLAHG